RKHFRDELDRGVAEANAMIAGSLFTGARGTDGSNPVPSSGESVSAVNSGPVGEKPRAFAPVCTASGTRDGDELAATPSFTPFSLKRIDAVPPRRFEASQRRPGMPARMRGSACEEFVLLGPVERQIEFSHTRRSEGDGLAALQDRVDEKRAQEGEVNEAPDVTPRDAVA